LRWDGRLALSLPVPHGQGLAELIKGQERLGWQQKFSPWAAATAQQLGYGGNPPMDGLDR
jgi:hypothetical protein